LKIFQSNSILPAALSVSFAVHALLLVGVRFVDPDAFRSKPMDPGLEVILVNAKHDRAPLKADALAQVNLDGGGNADAGHAKSPLPDMQKSEEGDALKIAKRHIDELEAAQKQLFSQAKTKTPFVVNPSVDKDNPQPVQPDGTDKVDSNKQISRQAAEIAKEIEDYNKRPRKTQLTPSTKRDGYALYYTALRTRIEKIGTVNFPQKDGKKLYGELLVYIPIFQDGTLYMKEGGPRVEHSSGDKALDKAALRIVRHAAPFGEFPKNMRSADKDDVWEVITRFKFSREEGLETELRGAGK
jgi:protein TonB